MVAPANERWSSYHIIVISNQKLTRGDGGLRKLEEWRKKMPIICRDVGRRRRRRLRSRSVNPSCRLLAALDLVAKGYATEGFGSNGRGRIS